MLLDQNTMLSDAQAVTASAASTHTVDTTAGGNVVPGGLFAVCRVDSAFAGLSQLKVALQTSDKADFSEVSELAACAFAAAQLTADTQLFAVPLLAGIKRYIRAYYTVTGTGTAGTLSCFLTDAVDMH